MCRHHLVLSNFLTLFYEVSLQPSACEILCSLEAKSLSFKTSFKYSSLNGIKRKFLGKVKQFLTDAVK